MADFADEASARTAEAERIALEAHEKKAKPYEPGEPGDCALCGLPKNRLVKREQGLVCAACRDKYRLDDPARAVKPL